MSYEWVGRWAPVAGAGAAFCNLCDYALSLHGDPPNCDVAALKAQLLAKVGI